jgi:hypothetical protein
MDGYYAMRITKEAGRNDENKKPGMFLTLEIMDQDAAGRTLSKFFGDPRTTAKDTWFTWRGLIRSITGGLDAARQGLRYTPGMFQNQVVYGRTQQYADSSGSPRTGVDAFVTKTEYDQAVEAKKHRWTPKLKGGGHAGGAGAVGSLPMGLPTAFAGMGGAGLPGAPASPISGMVPAPAASAPMMQAPQGFPTSAPQQGFAPPQPAPAAHAAPAQQGFVQFAPPAGAAPVQGFAPFAPSTAAAPAAPVASFTFPPPPAGAPQPQAAPAAAPAQFAFPPAPQIAATAPPAQTSTFAFPPPPGLQG